MAYEKHNYASGDVLLASELNEMDDAIEALDGGITELKSDLNIKEIAMTTSAYIKTGVAVGAVVDLTPISHADYEYAVIPCAEGDIFTISAAGGNAARSFCFIDSSNKAIYVSAGNTIFSSEFVTAPSNAVKLIVDNRLSTGAGLISYFGKISEVENLTAEVNALRQSQKISCIGSQLMQAAWESGGYDTVIGTPASSTIRVRTSKIVVRDGMALYVFSPSGYRLMAFYYGVHGEFKGCTDWSTNGKLSCEIPSGSAYAAFVAGYVNNNSISNVSAFSKEIAIYGRLALADSMDSRIAINAEQVPLTFEIGGIDPSSGTPASSSIAIRTKEYIDLENINMVTIQPLLVGRYRVYRYSPNFEYIDNSGWLSVGATYKATDARYIKVELRYSDQSQVSDVSALAGIYKILSLTPMAAGMYSLEAKIGSLAFAAISHRGTRLTRPDSTSAAYIRAAECGFRFAEGDIQRTSDGYYVIGHDDNISDRTGQDINISDTSLADLKSIDFGGYLFPDYAGQAILTLEEFLTLCTHLGMEPVLDLKTKTQEQVAEILDIIDRYGISVYNINGDLQTIKYVLAIKPEQFVRRSYGAYSDTVESEITSLFSDYPNCKFMVAYDISQNSWTKSVLDNLVSRGITVCPYELNRVQNVDVSIINSGADYIHVAMCGGEFNPVIYLKNRDNNVLI